MYIFNVPIVNRMVEIIFISFLTICLKAIHLAMNPLMGGIPPKFEMITISIKFFILEGVSVGIAFML